MATGTLFLGVFWRRNLVPHLTPGKSSIFDHFDRKFREAKFYGRAGIRPGPG